MANSPLMFNRLTGELMSGDSLPEQIGQTTESSESFMEMWKTEQSAASADATAETNSDTPAYVEEGQLAVDVLQTKDAVLVRSAIAGVNAEDIAIDVTADMLTIRGHRQPMPDSDDTEYLFRECFWGPFSRAIILPCEVRENAIKATLKAGILTVTLPKVKRVRRAGVKIQDLGEEV